MKSNRVLFLLLIIMLLTSCGGSGGGSSAPSPTLVLITLTPANPSIPLGTTLQFTARGTFSDASTRDVTASVAWNSSTPAVATISNSTGSNGFASSLATGTTTISAASGTVSASTTLTVTATALVSIEVTPAGVSIPTGTTQQFTAIGTYSDSTTKNISTPAIWSSSATDVATISSSGLATGVAAGTTMISAKSGSVSGSTTLIVTGGTGSAVNVMPITVNGSLCSPNTSAGYFNKPCVSITICTPGTTTCQTIDDILLDTGSYGLRVFQQALTVNLTQVTSTSPTGSLTNCAQFADGSADWGPVKLADVVLGSEPVVRVPIQVIDATFGTVPAACSTMPDLNPTAAGFNGILGVGLFAQDCGPTCVTSAVGIYYSCSGTTCNPTTVSLAKQITNPVVSLPTDSNGVIVELPSVSSSGTPSANGSLVMGIDTRTNNASTGATVFKADSFGEIRTTFNGTTYSSIVDSGSNGLFFMASSIPTCSSNSSWFCPASATTFSATNMGATGTPRSDVLFQVGNFNNLTNSSNMAFSNIGGFMTGLFDWGLPFYFGRDIYVGIENQGSLLGQGPYFAY